MNEIAYRMRVLSAGLAALVLAGCSGLLTSEQPAKQYYLLMPLASAATASASPTAPDLAVTVATVPGLDTDHVLALGTDAGLGRYGNARWPDHLPEVLSSVLARSLEATGRFRSVRAGGRPGVDGWSLQLELRAFYGLQDAAGNTGSVEIALAGALDCGDTSHAVDVAATSAVREQRVATVVAAHQAALDQATRQVIDRIAAACGEHS